MHDKSIWPTLKPQIVAVFRCAVVQLKSAHSKQKPLKILIDMQLFVQMNESTFINFREADKMRTPTEILRYYNKMNVKQ